MMPDLGKYAVPVLSAYGGSILILIALVWASVRSGRKARAELDAVETRKETSSED